jgi:hypothetical protein
MNESHRNVEADGLVHKQQNRVEQDCPTLYILRWI